MSRGEKLDEPGIYRKKSGKLYVRTTATDPNGETKERRKTLAEGASVEEAVAVREELKAEIRSAPDDSPEETDSQLKNTVASLAKNLLEERKRTDRWAESTCYENKLILSQSILPEIGHVPVSDFDRRTVARWIDWAENQRKENGDRYANATLQRWWKVVKKLVKRAYLEGFVERRLLEWCRDIQGPQSPVSGRRETETLSADELESFVDAAEEVAPGRYPEIVTLAYTGMRAGELYGLEWRDIHYDPSVIEVRRAVWRGTLKETKAGKELEIPMVPRVESALRRHHKRLMKERHLGLEEGIVFPSDKGGRRYPQSLYKPMDRATEYADIDQRVTAQVLRRTFNTLLTEPEDVDRLVLRSMTGHDSEEMTAHYAGIGLDRKRRALDRLPGGDNG